MRNTILTVIFTIIFILFFTVLINSNVVISQNPDNCWECIIDENGGRHATCRCYGHMWDCSNFNAFENCRENNTQPPVFEEFVWNLTSPVNNSIYNDRRIRLDIKTSHVIGLLKKSLNNAPFSTLCRNCDRYNRISMFNEGNNFLLLEAINTNGVRVYKNVSFFVDSRKPRIENVYPSKNSYSSGNFKIKYSEENLGSIRLYYKGESESLYRSFLLSNCSSGNSKECTAVVNLSSYDGRELYYYFNVSDRVSSVNSSVTRINIDISPSVITINNPKNRELFGTNRVKLNISLNEEVNKLDYSINGARSMNLCRNCKSYYGYKIFKNGWNNLSIETTNLNGLISNKSVSFFVDSRKPRILDIEPDKGSSSNGYFGIMYSEEYLDSILLFYKGKSEHSYHAYQLLGCSSGDFMGCNASLDIINYEDTSLDYYFSVSDKINSVDSNVNSIMIDMRTPSIDIISPVEGVEYDLSRIKLNITSDEKVSSLEYSINENSYRILCRNCNSYNRDFLFSSGPINLKIKAIDYANNVKIKEVNFRVR